MTLYSKVFKRIFDFSISLVVLVLFWWLYVALAIAVRVNLGAPVLFKQERIGKEEKSFYMFKFRTMLPPQDLEGNALTDAERLERLKTNPDSILSDDRRLTRFGRFLRSTSLDEIPEIFNILKGEMSFIGPRPLVSLYIPYYSSREHHRHDVLPGLTGLAQVRGRNSLSWEQRFEYDVQYAESCSFALDIKILLKTIAVVLKREGIGQAEEKPIAFHMERQLKWAVEKKSSDVK